MKIAQICPYDIFRSGGVQSHIESLSKELRRRGHEVKIIAPGVDGVKNTRDDVILLGSSVRLSMNKTQGELSVVAGKAKELVADVLVREKFDILHFHEPAMPVLPMQILIESNSINIATFHAALPKTFVGKSIELVSIPLLTSIIKMLDGVIAVSEVPAKHIGKVYDGNVNIIPNGIDVNVFKKENQPFKKYLDGKVNILFLGRLDKRKGVIYLLKAFRKLKKGFSDVRLIIGGKGDEFKRVTKYVKRYNLSDVEILGFVDEQDKPRLYSSCDIFCSPALYGESLGIVLLEAMASAKAVVAYSNPGYKTVLKGSGSLLLAKPKDVNGLREKLEILCNDKKLRDFMGGWGENEAKRYSWKSVCRRVLEVYKEAINKREEGGLEKRTEQSGGKILERWLDKIINKLNKY